MLAEDFIPYNLRQTYCTSLQNSGVDIRVAQKLMGYADIKLTANIYTHVDMDSLIDAGEKLDVLQKGTTGGTTLNTP